MKPFNQQLAGKQEGDYFGLRMRKSREHAGLTRAEAAKGLGLSPGQVGRIERGSVQMVSDPFTLVLAGRTYGVSDVWLYAGAAGATKLIPDWYSPA